ncbi:MAG: type II toxin-antitoxin system HicB family antitoxin [Candidatus Magasanikbacteria bacterium]|nr:type II toxin-antitoxin system HicB family antitoxin [Candidatus Magasanikbacteria bacterium]
MRKTNNFHYNLIFRPESEGGFTVIVPSLPGCISYGKTLEEARKNAADAIGGYIVSLKKHKEPIPNDDQSFITSLDFDFVKHYAAAA